MIIAIILIIRVIIKIWWSIQIPIMENEEGFFSLLLHLSNGIKR